MTIRCPHAVRAPNASTRAGVAAKDGEMEKFHRYGPAVQPIAMETYGRMGSASAAAVRCLADAIASNGRGDAVPTARMVEGLRLAAERALLYYIADVTRLSVGAGATSSLWMRGGVGGA